MLVLLFEVHPFWGTGVRCVCGGAVSHLFHVSRGCWSALSSAQLKCPIMIRADGQQKRRGQRWVHSRHIHRRLRKYLLVVLGKVLHSQLRARQQRRRTRSNISHVVRGWHLACRKLRAACPTHSRCCPVVVAAAVVPSNHVSIGRIAVVCISGRNTRRHPFRGNRSQYRSSRHADSSYWHYFLRPLNSSSAAEETSANNGLTVVQVQLQPPHSKARELIRNAEHLCRHHLRRHAQQRRKRGGGGNEWGRRTRAKLTGTRQQRHATE